MLTDLPLSVSLEGDRSQLISGTALHNEDVQTLIKNYHCTDQKQVLIKGKIGPEHLFVGFIYLNVTPTKFVCNTLLLKARWSLSTAHCAAVRTDPDMAHLLFAWKLRYKLVSGDKKGTGFETFVTTVKRSIANSLFERETFANNVGLFEHTEAYPLAIPSLGTSAPTLKSEDQSYVLILGWNRSDIELAGITLHTHKIEPISHDVQYIRLENCKEILSPVTLVRSYEFCVKMKNKRQIYIDYGAVVFDNFKVMGIFSWGEKVQKHLPMVILNVTLFQDWFKMIAGS